MKTIYCIQTNEEFSSARDFLWRFIDKSEPECAVDQECNSITFWVKTNLTLEEVKALSFVKDVSESTMEEFKFKPVQL